MNGVLAFTFQRHLIVYLLLAIFCLTPILYVLYFFLLYLKRVIKNLLGRSVGKNMNQDAWGKILEVEVVLLFTVIALVADKDWLYALYLFIIGPRIASESYLINIIKAWKTTRREQRYERVIENPKLENKPIQFP